MIDLSTLLKIAIPVVGSIINNEITSNTSPKKQENIYSEIVPMAISTIATSLFDTNNTQQQNTPTVSPSNIVNTQIMNSSPYEIAKNKKYKYNF